jgi:hypothetical protein
MQAYLLKLFIGHFNACWLRLVFEIANELCTINCNYSLIFSVRKCRSNLVDILILKQGPIPVVARSKAWVCGRSLPGIAVSNHTSGMDVCLL